MVLAFKAWAVGLLAATFLGLPLASFPAAPGPVEGALAFLAGYPRAVLSNLVLVSTIGPVLSAPLFGLALALGLLSRGAIAAHPLWATALAGAATAGIAGLAGQVGGAGFRAGITGASSLVFTLSVLPAAWYFATALARADRSGASPPPRKG